VVSSTLSPDRQTLSPPPTADKAWRFDTRAGRANWRKFRSCRRERPPAEEPRRLRGAALGASARRVTVAASVGFTAVKLIRPSGWVPAIILSLKYLGCEAPISGHIR